MALAEEPATQEKLYEEMVSVLGEPQSPTFQVLKYMPLLDRCVKESLRLYPSVTLMGRVAVEEIHTKTGYIIPKGYFIHTMIHDLHRRPELYEDPDKFNPDRILYENYKLL
ncbi:unnamed protein product [Diabrotica balteata]|uniref:Cytochrome P450 n=1 Tax=Diabrotica balteata TaxID=107213 RepID=A0A9N9T7S9_DIABA|nr:unnamed protein product [Diabrotica balteata]